MAPNVRMVLPDCERPRERAIWCRQLAASAGDVKFAAILNAIAKEYDGKAERQEATANSPK